MMIIIITIPFYIFGSIHSAKASGAEPSHIRVDKVPNLRIRVKRSIVRQSAFRSTLDCPINSNICCMLFIKVFLVKECQPSK